MTPDPKPVGGTMPDDIETTLRAALANTPYRPPNGTEGIMFDYEWCAKCKRDAAFRADMDNNDGCPIAAATFLFPEDDPNYPKEWVYDAKGFPMCTAFEEIAHD